MEQSTIDQLIINKPYEEPQEYWRYHRERRTFSREQGRRSAGYLKATPNSRDFDDPGRICRNSPGQPNSPQSKGVARGRLPRREPVSPKDCWNTGPTQEEFDNRRFFFCQLEAVETLIWLTEAADQEKAGLEIPGDGGPLPAPLFPRWLPEPARPS